jgi:hypothetical protein
MTRRGRLLGTLTTAVLLASVLGGRWPVQAAPGEPDRSFGTGGVITTDFDGGPDQARALVVEPDGKVLAAGFAVDGGSFQFALARFEGALFEGGVR